ncbi:putative plant self-incompatibility S1 [Arabidopsis thaliana]
MDCDIREIIQNRFVRIRAYQGSSGSFDHGKTNYWDIREDGVYFTHGKDVPKLEYKW